MKCNTEDIERYLELIGQTLDHELGKGKIDIDAISNPDKDCWMIHMYVAPRCNNITMIYAIDDALLYEFKSIAKIDRQLVIAHLVTILTLVKQFYADLDFEQDRDTNFIVEWQKNEK